MSAGRDPASAPEPAPQRAARAVAWAALVCGLVFVACGGALFAADAWMATLLPAEPQRFLRARALLQTRIAVVMLPLGLLCIASWTAEMARAPDLRGLRARLRLLGIVAVTGLAVLGGLTDGLVERALAASAASDGAALHAAVQRIRGWRWIMVGLQAATLVSVLGAHFSPAPPPPAREGPDGRYRSVWVPPVFGETPALPARQWRVIGLMVAAGFFNAYDMQLFSLALKQIQAGLGIEEARLGLLGSVIRLGVVPGALLALLADSHGRRRVLLWTIAGYTLATGATAFAPDERTFVVCQFLARIFGAAEAILAGVVIAEEVDADQRGWALGVLGAFSFFGVALAWVLFASVEVLPGGWRSLYAVGLGPLLLIAWLRRRLPETRRFEARGGVAEAASRWEDTIRPLARLARAYPGRIAAAAGVAVLMSFSGQAAGFFLPKTMQEVHGLAPAQLTLVGAFVGVLGLAAMPLLGRLGDRRGRKPVAISFIVLNPLCVIGFYLGGGLAVPLLFFLGMTLTDIGSDTNLATFARELFPTSYRSTASGALAIASQLGGSLGLAMESLLYGWLASHGHAISLLAVTGLVVPFLVGWGYPETGSRELEEISPESPSLVSRQARDRASAEDRAKRS